MYEWAREEEQEKVERKIKEYGAHDTDWIMLIEELSKDLSVNSTLVLRQAHTT